MTLVAFSLQAEPAPSANSSGHTHELRENGPGFRPGERAPSAKCRAEGARFRVPNWRRFQHYADRRPPWIKLHRTLLEDFAFASLSDASAALAPRLWLLASETADGSFSANLDELAFRLARSRDRVAAALEELEHAGFLQRETLPASSVLAARLQRATLETELEAEGEKGAARKPRGKTTPFAPPTEQDVQRHLDAIGERRFTGKRFCAYYGARGWMLGKGRRMRSWKAAIRTWQCNEDEKLGTKTPGLDDARAAAALGLDKALPLDLEEH